MNRLDNATPKNADTIPTIRPLEVGDFERWLTLWDGYLEFYRQEIAREVTLTTFEDLVAQRDGLFGLVAEGDGGGLIGFTHSVIHRSTWTESPHCYLEDLYVSPHGRGGDLGRRLIEETRDVANSRGAVRLYWHTQQFNGRARSLYDQVGSLTSRVLYEMDASGTPRP